MRHTCKPLTCAVSFPLDCRTNHDRFLTQLNDGLYDGDGDIWEKRNSNQNWPTKNLAVIYDTQCVVKQTTLRKGSARMGPPFSKTTPSSSPSSSPSAAFSIRLIAKRKKKKLQKVPSLKSAVIVQVFICTKFLKCFLRVFLSWITMKIVLHAL